MKYTYETYYKSARPDGRIVPSLAAEMERARRTRPALSALKNPTKEEFLIWQEQVREKVKELCVMPPFTEQPAPVLLSTVQRDGYRVERWEFYPDDVAAVPVLLMVPDSATAEHPAPLVLCFTGSFGNKEYIADEPNLPGEACNIDRYPERNRMGKYYVENGMIAACFDPLSMGELSLDSEDPGHGWHSRTSLSSFYIVQGYSYTSVSVRNAFCFMSFLKSLPIVDETRIATSGHSLGTEVAIYMAMLSDEIKAVVFNDLVSSHYDRFISFTEHEALGDRLAHYTQIHIVPGAGRYFDLKDLCAAMAPRPLTCNEGGAEEHLNEVRAAYAALGAEDKLQISHYPKFTDPASRNHAEQVPLYGLSDNTYFEYTNTDAPDHSFRKEPSVAFLKKHFGLE